MRRAGFRLSNLIAAILFLSAASPLARGQLQPGQLLSAYGFNTAQSTYTGAGQTIAIYTAEYYPGLQTDVNSFSTAYMNGNTTTITATTTSGAVPASGSITNEMALDVEYAHLIAPAAKIMVVEDSSQSTAALYAAQHGASVFSDSWSTYESGSTASEIQTADSRYATVAGLHVVSLSAAGDSSHVNYPASSPYVVGVTGTNLTVNSDGSYGGETAWNVSGGGTSSVESEPLFQENVQSTNKRSTPDVSIVGGTSSTLPVYVNGAVVQEHGSSIASPIWGGLIALADQARAAIGQPSLGTTQLLSNLYGTTGTSEYSTIFNDITTGSNPTSGLSAGIGYDELTGLGSPKVPAMIGFLTTVPSPEPTSGITGMSILMLFLQRRRRCTSSPLP